MNYLNEKEIEYCKKNQNAILQKFISDRLILSNVDEETYLSEMNKAFPDMQTESKKMFNYEVIPRLSMKESPDNNMDFASFIEATSLASLKIDTFGSYTLNTGTAVNQKKDVPYTVEYYLHIVGGRFYDQIITVMENEEGEEQRIVSSKLKLSIRLRIKYAYNDGDTTYIGYRIGNDKKDRTDEISQAIDTIKNLYHLSPKDCYSIKLYLDDIVPKYLKFDKPSDSKISITDNIIHVNFPVEFDEKIALQSLVDIYKITTQKELMNFLMLYAPITPFNVQLRQKEMIMPLPMALGKGGAGKSAMVKMIVVKGFDNPDAEKSEDDIYTKASFRENFSKSIYPIMIDEITQYTMMRIYGSMKNLSTGKGTHSRGRATGGLNEWTLSAIPVFTSNETIYIDSGMERRFFKIIANDADNNIKEWRKAKLNLPDGFLYMFLKEMDNMHIDDLVAKIISHVEHDEDYVYAYQLVIKEIMDKVFKEHDLVCPFEPVRKVIYDDDDWYVAFGQFIMQNVYDYKNGNNTYLKEGFDFEIDDGTDEVYVTKLGFQKFLKIFPRCLIKNASSFAINAPDNNYIIEYKKKRVCHSKNPIHVISVYERGEEIQMKFNGITEQLEAKFTNPLQ